MAPTNPLCKSLYFIFLPSSMDKPCILDLSVYVEFMHRVKWDKKTVVYMK